MHFTRHTSSEMLLSQRPTTSFRQWLEQRTALLPLDEWRLPFVKQHKQTTGCTLASQRPWHKL
jgi:hypothetical protein